MAVLGPRRGNSIVSSIIPGLIGALVGCLASFLYISTSFDGIDISAGAIAPPEQRFLHAEVEDAVEKSGYEGHEDTESEEEEEEGFEVRLSTAFPFHDRWIRTFRTFIYRCTLLTWIGSVGPVGLRLSY